MISRLSGYIKYLIKRYTSKDTFGANVLILFMGTAIAQAISLGASPILTRSYSPGDFGIFAIYIAIASILSVLATGRYELAITLPKDDDTAINIFALSLLITVIISLLSLIAAAVFNQPLASLLNIKEINRQMYLIPLTVFMTGAYQTLNYWLIRRKLFKALAFSKVSLFTSMVCAQIALFFICRNVNGLIYGYIIGQAIGLTILTWHTLKNDAGRIKLVYWRRIIQQAKRYINFPLYSLLSDFINITSNQIPNIFLNNHFGTSSAGFFSLSQKILDGPVALLGGSALDVFKERASSDYIKYGNCRAIYVKLFKSLLLFSLAPAIAFAFFAPQLFAFVFGARWLAAGQYAQILSPMFFLRFISRPFGYIFYVAEKQNYNLVWQIFLLIFTVLSFTIGVNMHSAKIGILCFSLSYSALYIAYILLSFYFANGDRKKNG
jgi:O-antigen/teichoic acid export membrane protein